MTMCIVSIEPFHYISTWAQPIDESDPMVRKDIHLKKNTSRRENGRGKVRAGLDDAQYKISPDFTPTW